jgi:hypothetical protein
MLQYFFMFMTGLPDLAKFSLLRTWCENVRDKTQTHLRVKRAIPQGLLLKITTKASKVCLYSKLLPNH